ncbi:P-loop containing protein [Fusarium bulbicola]|nr:P-loop containing protein [Fusarium bulbicola]
MVTLLERFYDPVSGTVTLDNRNIDTINPKKYRANIGLVQQEPVLYQGSIQDNILLGIETEVTSESIADACRQANIYDFIMSLPEGFGTLCGSKGGQLSGGQKQRLAIARALMRKPRILLLDEATSALDTESERHVQKALEKASTGRTTVAIAHRLSTIKDADKIVVIQRGRIVEAGTHEELMAQRRVYYDMCLAQAMDSSS